MCLHSMNIYSVRDSTVEWEFSTPALNFFLVIDIELLVYVISKIYINNLGFLIQIHIANLVIPYNRQTFSCRNENNRNLDYSPPRGYSCSIVEKWFNYIINLKLVYYIFYQVLFQSIRRGAKLSSVYGIEESCCTSDTC